MADTTARVLDERNWLMDLVDKEPTITVTDSGYSFPQDEGEFVYETHTGRYEVTIRRLADA